MKVSRSYSRPQILVLAVAVLFVANVLWHLVFDWGRVTLHVEKAPLRKVVASIARQGHIRLRTNLDPDTPVTLTLDNVPVTEALETLSIVTDSRWRLAYLVGPRQGDLLAMLRDWEGGTRDEGWDWIEHMTPSLPGVNLGSDPDAAPVDPRTERVVFRPEGITELHPLLDEVTVLADAQAVVAKDWNPSIGAIQAEAPVGGVIAKLAHAGHGTAYEVFLLSGRRHDRNAPAVADDSPGEPPPQSGGGRGNPQQMAKGVQARINRLPAAERPAAQAKFDEMKAFFLSLRDLPPDQRRARMDQMRNTPGFQDQMDARMEARESKMTPDQRTQRAQRYVANKAAVKGT